MPSLSVTNHSENQFNKESKSQPSTINEAYLTSHNLQNSLNSIQSANSNNYSGTNNFNNINEQLNYIIHLLEEQQNSKTSTTSEELILYTFLGVFTIYIVDSFTKVGKSYTR